MAFRYHLADISFCPDLVAPERELLLRSVLLLGEHKSQENLFVLASSVGALPDLDTDPLIQEVFREYPALLMKQVVAIIQRGGLHQSIDEVVDRFEEQMCPNHAGLSSFMLSELQRGLESPCSPDTFVSDGAAVAMTRLEDGLDSAGRVGFHVFMWGGEDCPVSKESLGDV